MLQFEKIICPEEEDPRLWNDFKLYQELLSALAPDLCSLLYNGKLDREAIQDCASFLNATVARKRDRNINLWAVLLYFMLVINYMFQAQNLGQGFAASTMMLVSVTIILIPWAYLEFGGKKRG